ncbi:LytR/AlgR family response regulator transcription factor [Aurantiacibacter sp. MUD61]|uniref:LytR/AlgR family response regulator transcription factor n=1 Tax=Aurantiacibacter sp. MUD61 TaxID=3009083 RepID=UPI0022F014BB|nr:LytTR family DNA-binding domain-containing protein [Aurantiacibacter sp. MUD61]
MRSLIIDARTGSVRASTWVVAGAALLFTAYVLVFALTTGDDLRDNARDAVVNTLPAILLALLFHAVLKTQIWPRSLPIRLASQIPLALLFASSWYLTILLMQGLQSGWMQSGIAIRPFVPIAFVWQMFQGVTLYAVIALGSLSWWLSLRLALETGATEEEARPPTPKTLLLRNGKESEAVSIDDLVRISGAGDYSEVVLRTRRVMSTSPLTYFQKRLPEAEFLRVHRSHIVRLGAVERSEPGGNGRAILHLVNGDSITSSRSGAQALRKRVL